MNTNDVGRFISELRKEKGFTQKELAEKLVLDVGLNIQDILDFPQIIYDK